MNQNQPVRTICFALPWLLTPSVLPAQCASVVTGTTANDHFGWSLACVGDIDGDGADDLAVGAPQANNPTTGGTRFGPGYVKVLSGRTGTVLRTINSPAGTASRGMFGYSLAAFADSDGDGRPDRSGDVDGDGVPDFLVGAPFFDGTRPSQGIVYLVSGATGATTAVPNPAAAPTTTEEFGRSVTALGPLGIGSRGAFAVGAPGAAVGSSGNRGRVDVFDLPIGGGPAVLVGQRTGSATGQFYGMHVLGIGRASGGSGPDLLVGSDNPDAAGNWTVELLRASSLFLQRTFVGAFTGFGTVLGGVGDLDSDGRPEFAIGGDACSTCPSNRDTLATVHSWPATAAVPLQVATLLRPRFFVATALGTARSIANIGDLDGDGLPDVLVGIPLADPVGIAASQSDAGEVRAFSGASLATSPHMIGVFDGLPGEQLGSGVAPLGDVDGDGKDDFACSAPLAGAAAGRVVINRFASRAMQNRGDCTSSLLGAPPELHVRADVGPCQGSALELHASTLPANSWVGYGLALSGFPQPNVPGPGCTLMLQPTDVYVLFSGPNTFTNLQLNLPQSPIFLGLTVHAQAIFVGGSSLSLWANTQELLLRL